MVSYKNLWKLLIDRGLTKTELRERAGLTKDAVTKMGKEAPVHLRSIDAICTALDCKIDDIVQYIPGKSPEDDGAEKN